MLNQSRHHLASACFALLTLVGCVDTHFDDGAMTRLLESASCSGITSIPNSLYCQYSANLARADLFGSGTTSDPYQICSPYQLQAIGTNAALLSAAYKVTANIDMSCIAGNHTQIGSSTSPFRGDWDGNGKTINGWKHQDATSDYGGLFAYTRNAKIYELTLTGANVTGKNYTGIAVGRADGTHLYQIATGGTLSGTNDVGGVVGRSNAGAVNQSSSSAIVTGASGVGGVVGGGDLPIVVSSSFSGALTATGANAGGVIGNSTTGFIANSYSTGSVTSSSSAVGGVAGIAGDLVENTYSTGSISGTTSVGGLVGSLLSSSSLTSSFSVSTVTGNGGSSANVGRLIGTNAGTMSNSYYHSGATCDADSATGGIQACNTIAAGTQASASAFYLTTTAPVSSWDFQGETAIGTMDEWSSTTGGYPVAWYLNPSSTGIPFFDGNGTASDPYQIGSVTQYNLISANPRWMGSHFKLTANLSFTTSAAKQIGSLHSPFFGTFNGNGKTLSNVNIVGTSFVGLFGVTLPQSTISSLTISASTITGNRYVGGVVGLAEGDITSVKFVGDLTVGENSGGLVGFAAWPATISGGTASVAIAADTLSSSVGGLAGKSTGVISRSMSANTITGALTNIGGLVGQVAGGTVANSYSTGYYTDAVATRVGGLVGYLTGSAVISNSYSGVTEVGGSEELGGLVGKTDAGTTITASFTVTDESGETSTDLVGALVGSHAGTATNSWTLATAVCDPGSGVCNTLGYTAASTLTDFYTTTNAPLSSWNFTTIWQSSGSALPTHR